MGFSSALLIVFGVPGERLYLLNPPISGGEVFSYTFLGCQLVLLFFLCP